jgi:hypothetical protein
MKDAAPDTVPSRVVCKTVKPNELMMSEYWFVIPLAISCDQACRKKSHVFGSLIASMNLYSSRQIIVLSFCVRRDYSLTGIF